MLDTVLSCSAAVSRFTMDYKRLPDVGFVDVHAVLFLSQGSRGLVDLCGPSAVDVTQSTSSSEKKKAFFLALASLEVCEHDTAVYE